LKRVAERALKYILGVCRDGSDAKHAAVAINAIQAVDGNLAKVVKEYSKKTLSRLADDSDDETDKW
jgi:hypothetical protein